ncbi:MAG: hypothetical protein ACRDJC_19725 [Thermomicrobiales bacterium]
MNTAGTSDFHAGAVIFSGKRTGRETATAPWLDPQAFATTAALSDPQPGPHDRANG